MVLMSGRLAAERVTGLRRDDERPGATRTGRGRHRRTPRCARATRRAARINAEHGKTYYLATLLLPPAKRPYVHALYGFARHADDIVDDHAGADARRARRPARRVERRVPGRPRLGRHERSGEPRGASTRSSAGTSRRRYFADFLDSMRMDLTVTSVPDLRRPGPVHVGLGRGDRAADAADPRPARRRGALGRPRAARDRSRHRVPADQLHPRRRRGPAPRPGLPAAGVAATGSASTASGCARGRVDEPIRNLLACEIERARGLYRRAAPGIDLRAPDLAGLPAHRVRRSTPRSWTRSSAPTTTCSAAGSRVGAGSPRPGRPGAGCAGSSDDAARPAHHTHSASVSSHQREAEQQVLDRRVDEPPAR